MFILRKKSNIKSNASTSSPRPSEASKPSDTAPPSVYVTPLYERFATKGTMQDSSSSSGKPAVSISRPMTLNRPGAPAGTQKLESDRKPADSRSISEKENGVEKRSLFQGMNRSTSHLPSPTPVLDRTHTPSSSRLRDPQPPSRKPSALDRTQAPSSRVREPPLPSRPPSALDSSQTPSSTRLRDQLPPPRAPPAQSDVPPIPSTASARIKDDKIQPRLSSLLPGNAQVPERQVKDSLRQSHHPPLPTRLATSPLENGKYTGGPQSISSPKVLHRTPLSPPTSPDDPKVPLWETTRPPAHFDIQPNNGKKESTRLPTPPSPGLALKHGQSNPPPSVPSVHNLPEPVPPPNPPASAASVPSANRPALELLSGPSYRAPRKYSPLAAFGYREPQRPPNPAPSQPSLTATMNLAPQQLDAEPTLNTSNTQDALKTLHKGVLRSEHGREGHEKQTDHVATAEDKPSNKFIADNPQMTTLSPILAGQSPLLSASVLDGVDVKGTNVLNGRTARLVSPTTSPPTLAAGLPTNLQERSSVALRGGSKHRHLRETRGGPISRMGSEDPGSLAQEPKELSSGHDTPVIYQDNYDQEARRINRSQMPTPPTSHDGHALSADDHTPIPTLKQLRAQEQESALGNPHFSPNVMGGLVPGRPLIFGSSEVEADESSVERVPIRQKSKLNTSDSDDASPDGRTGGNNAPLPPRLVSSSRLDDSYFPSREDLMRRKPSRMNGSPHLDTRSVYSSASQAGDEVYRPSTAESMSLDVNYNAKLENGPSTSSSAQSARMRTTSAKKTGSPRRPGSSRNYDASSSDSTLRTSSPHSSHRTRKLHKSPPTPPPQSALATPIDLGTGDEMSDPFAKGDVSHLSPVVRTTELEPNEMLYGQPTGLTGGEPNETQNNADAGQKTSVGSPVAPPTPVSLEEPSPLRVRKRAERQTKPPTSVLEAIARVEQQRAEQLAPEPEPEPREPTFYPLQRHLTNPALLSILLSYFSFHDWCVMTEVNDAMRRVIEHTRELREIVLERFLSIVGYATWKWAKKEPILLTFRDLNSYMRGVSVPTHQYAVSAQAWLESKWQPTGDKQASVTKHLLASSCRAYTRVVLRLRAQAEMEAADRAEERAKHFNPLQSSSTVNLGHNRSRSGFTVSRPPSPTDSAGHSFYPHSQNGHSSRPATRRSPSENGHTASPSPAQTSHFRSPLFRMGHAPMLRVFVPSAEGAWLSDASVLDCEKELKRAGVLPLMKVGDVVWDAAVGDEGNVGRMIWDGNYLIDLDYTYSRTGDAPHYIHALAFPPSYFHRVIRTSGNPICHIDLSPWSEEIAANLQLLQDRVKTETPQGGHHTVVHWIHRSRFRIRPSPHRSSQIAIPGTSRAVDPGWYGTVVVETEGTNEGLADLQDRCKSGFPARAGADQGKAGSRVFKLLRERSRPGEIWIRAVREKERLM